MKQVRETVIGFLVGIIIYAVVIFVVGFFFSENLMRYTLGLIYGVVVSVLLFFHITVTLDKALDMPEQGATKYVKRQALLRLFLMLVAMIGALVVPQLHFISALLGMLGLKIGSFIASPLLKVMYPEDFVTKPEDVYTE